MNYFLACMGCMIEVPGFELLKERYEKKFNELRSYWEIADFKGHTLSVYGNNFFLDSGAFSAKMQKFEINLPAYGRWVKRYSDQIAYFANLDAIPKNSSPEEMVKGAKETWENQKKLEDITGRTPLPVFHKGEPIEYLHKYLEEYDYICIGGLMNQSCSNKVFFDLVWRYNLVGQKPLRKLHGFGLSSHRHLLHYPWYSADSSTWLMQSKHGTILIPRRNADNTGYDYLARPELLAISDKSSMRQKLEWHFDTCPEYQQQYILDYLKYLDVKFEDLRGHAFCRMVVNANYWVEFGKAIDERNKQNQPRPNRQITLL